MNPRMDLFLIDEKLRHDISLALDCLPKGEIKSFCGIYLRVGHELTTVIHPMIPGGFCYHTEFGKWIKKTLNNQVLPLSEKTLKNLKKFGLKIRSPKQ